jgi:hypothetical protein
MVERSAMSCFPSIRVAAHRAGLVALAVAMSSLPGVAAATQGPHSVRVGLKPGTCALVLFGALVECVTVPGADVHAELRDAGGALKAEGDELARTDGTVWLQLLTPTREQATTRPGDTLVVEPEGGQPFPVTVPRLVADVTIGSDQIVGRGIPLGSVTAALGSPYSSGTPIGTASVEANGLWALSVPRAQLAPGGYGFVRQADPAGNQFLAMFGVFAADIAVGWPEIGGLASGGTSVVVRFVDGAKSVEQTVEARYDSSRSQPRWSAPTPTIRPGARIEITRTSAVTGAQVTETIQVPDLSVSYERSRGLISGTGPPLTDLRLSAGRYRDIELGRAPISTTARTSAAGTFTLDAASLPELQPGWTIQTASEVSEHVGLRALHTLRMTRITVYGADAWGTVEPRQPVTVTLISPPGVRKGQAVTRSGPDGVFNVRFVGYSLGANVAIAPLDHIELEVGRLGDPVLIPIPMLSATTDAQAGTIRGAGPPGWQASAAVVFPSQSAVATTVVDASGRYLLLGQLAPGMVGNMVFRSPTGDEMVTQWAALRMEVDIRASGTSVYGAGPQGRDVDGALLSPAGLILGRCSGRLGAGAINDVGAWGCRPVDTAGEPVLPRPGDLIAVTVGDDHVEMVMPDVSLVVDPESDTVHGRIAPNRSGRLVVRRSLSPEFSPTVNVASDSTGAFAYDFSGVFDIRPQDLVLVGFDTADGAYLRYERSAPGIVLDLTRAEVQGATPQAGDVTITLRSGPQVRFTATTSTDKVGSFNLVLEGHGAVVYPQPGDELTVRPAGAGAPLVQLTVPDLSLAVDRVERVVRGQSSAGGTLLLRASAPAFAVRDATGLYGEAMMRVKPSDRFEVAAKDFRSGPDNTPSPLALRRGQQIEARLVLASGHQIVRRTTIPMVNVAYGGAQACGFGDPGQAVAVTVPRGARGDLAAVGEVGRDGRFEVLLRDGAGKPGVTEAGQLVQTQVDGDEMSLNVPAISARADWVTTPSPGWGLPAARITGTGPARAEYHITLPTATDAPCFAAASSYRLYATYGTTSRAGAFDTLVDSIPPGRAIEAAFYDANGNRVFSRVQRLLGRVYLGTPRVVARGQPFTPGSVLLRGPDGAPRARQEAVTDPSGWLDLRLAGETGEAVPSAVGDTVEVTIGEETAAIPVEALGFDFSPNLGLTGMAPPSRPVRLRLGLADRRLLEFVRTTDEGGRFAYRVTDLPPRRDWELADIDTIEAMLQTANGHEIVVEARVGTRPTAPPLYLPFARRPR